MMHAMIFRVLYVFMVLFGVFCGLSNPSYSMAPRGARILSLLL